MICGKAASGKSTLTASLGQEQRTIVVSEDDWLAGLFGDQMTSIADYVRFSARLREVLGPHVVQLLRSGLSVVLDFPANTPATRAWMRGLANQSGAAHKLHFLDVPDNVCKARLRARNEKAEHQFALTEAQFDQITKHFVPPSDDEGLEIVRYPGGRQ